MPEEIPRNQNYRPEQMQGQQQQFAPPQRASYEPARQAQSSGTTVVSCLVMGIIAIGVILLLIWLVSLVLGSLFAAGAGGFVIIILVILIALIFGNNKS